MTKNNKMLEVILTLGLFTLFVICSFYVLLLGANSYQTIVEEGDNEIELRVASSYFTTKIRENSINANVTVQQIDDKEVLVIDTRGYSTYIFYENGVIKEAIINNDYATNLELSVEMIEIADCKISKDGNKVLILLTDSIGHEEEIVLLVR